MAGLFIGYRRSDSAGYAGRLMDDLTVQFPDCEIFRDIEAIEAGVDFVNAIDKAVGSCPALLALIGPRWLTAVDNAGKRRIDDSNDFVRLELATALRRDVRVIPILLEGATMPVADDLPEDIKALARRQAHELSDRRWDYDVDQLFAVLEKVPGLQRKSVVPPTAVTPPPRKGMSFVAKAGIAFAVLIAALVMLGGLMPDEDVEPDSYLDSGMQDNEVASAAAQESPQANMNERAETAPAATVARAPAAQPIAPARSRQPQPQYDESEELDALCANTAGVAGTWQWSVANGAPGILVITQHGDALTVAEFNALGQQIGVGTGNVCGNEIEIDISNALWGEFSMSLSASGRAMNGNIFFQGQQAPVQAMWQG